MKKQIINISMLQRAVRDVRKELCEVGFDETDMPDVYLTPFGYAHGVFWGYDRGEVHIPQVSIARAWNILSVGSSCSLRSILRHEAGHHIVAERCFLFDTRLFRDAFGARRGKKTGLKYDPEVFISPYARKNSEEDFCECLAEYVRWRNHEFIWPTAIQAKMDFIKHICKTVKAERGRLC